ncbi:MAG: hypothetical protein JW751_15540 [Polyangiaceae bacterium]|nr:hypothetical protein [Polyangiaceae bacterium]
MPPPDGSTPPVSAPVVPPPAATPRALPIGVVRGRPVPAAAPAGGALGSDPRPTTPEVGATARHDSAPPSATGDQALDPRIEAAVRALGLPELGRAQRRLVRSVLERRSVLAVAPDSAGLRAAVHVSGLVASEPVVIVSPRGAALREHCERLQVRRLPAVYLAEDASSSTRTEALARISTGGSLLVFASPAVLRDEAVGRTLRAVRLAAIVVEEAHAASDWSHELSPALQAVSHVIVDLSPAAVVALVPAAVPIAARDVAEHFLLRHATRIELPLLRPNVVLECVAGRGDARRRALLSLVSRLRRPGLVFCPTAADVDAVYAALGAVRVPVHRYHGGLAASERSAELVEFMMPGRRAVMIATSAFAPAASPPFGSDSEDVIPLDLGLRLEKRDLRFMIHHQSPASLEQLVREVDLVGRDGEPATAVLLYDTADPQRWEQALAGLRPRPGLIVRMATELSALAHDGGSTTLDSLALTTGLSRAHARLYARLLADAGWVRLTDGWVQPVVSRAALLDRARRLAETLETFAVQDSERCRALHHLGEGRGCRAALVHRYFGGSNEARCGRCSICTGSSAALWGDEPEAAPRRRPEAQSFTLSGATGRQEAPKPEVREEPAASIAELASLPI